MWNKNFCSVKTPGHTPSLRWDETPGRAKGSETPGATPGSKIWDPTPSHTPTGAATPGRGDTPGHATPGHGGATSSARKNRWDETPKTERGTSNGVWMRVGVKFWNCVWLNEWYIYRLKSVLSGFG